MSFVLTGGGALAGFHLGHRTSDDLDLFGKPPVALEDGVRAIHASGLDLPTILADAERKDGGVAAATLAWVLDSVRIGPEASLPGVSPGELDAFRRQLVVQLRAMAKPAS